MWKSKKIEKNENFKIDSYTKKQRRIVLLELNKPELVELFLKWPRNHFWVVCLVRFGEKSLGGTLIQGSLYTYHTK